jgi:L-ascorbate metabolism protein UlaG (beta-lactamase superfamily)
MKLTWHGHSAFRVEAGEAKILIDPFLSDNPRGGSAAVHARTRHGDADDEGDRSDGPG